MGTTKLTRKQILAEDPVHEAMVQMVGFFRLNAKKVAVLAALLVIIAVGIFFGIQYLNIKETRAQEQLSKGIEFFRAEVSPDASDDPYAKGPTPVFRTEELKYQAAAHEFSMVVSSVGYSKTSIIARYYLGLCQLKLGQKKDAIRNLENVANNSRNRTVGYLAKRVLATENMNSGNYAAAGAILEGMLKDSQCNLPKEDLSLQLSQVLLALGKRDEAVKVLKEASTQGPAFSPLKQRLATELEKLEKATKTGSGPSSK